MSTRMTSAQGDPCALSVGESLLGQHGFKQAEKLSATGQSYTRSGVDAQIDAQTPQSLTLHTGDTPGACNGLCGEQQTAHQIAAARSSRSGLRPQAGISIYRTWAYS